MTDALEINFDGLVGPTHNYAGLSIGNVASMGNALAVSSPADAALQGLAKMRALHDLGVPQAVLPPHERPDVGTLRRLGFAGDDTTVMHSAARQAPAVFRACCSASAMWTANAATASPGADTSDRRLHLTPANLSSKFHRAIEAATTTRVLRAIFADPAHFVVHEPLPGGEHFADEGAANHTRLSAGHGTPGVELFVYGRRAFADGPAPRRFPARQTEEACQAVARRHRLDPARTVLAQQHPDTIDAGVFHNDVIAVGHLDVLLCHRSAFLDRTGTHDQLRAAVGESLHVIELDDSSLTVAESVETYLFNSQLVRPPGRHGMTLIAPAHCQEHERARAAIEGILLSADNPIDDVRYLDVRQSMRNGGGPACLRQRIVLDRTERRAVPPGVMLGDDPSFARLEAWIRRHYRDRLSAEDLEDPRLLDESRAALDELTGILGLGSVYPFQLT